jgi:protein-disulfide isomerase/uncharacterized membrane protein
MSEGVNCETVAISPYSVFAGLPVSAWGFFAYLVMGVLALWSLSKRRLHATWPFGLFLVLTSVSVAVSALLAFISATRIDSVCLFCMGSYLLNAGLMVVSLFAWRNTQKHVLVLVLDDVKSLSARPIGTALFGMSSVAIVAALIAFVPAYWRSPGWSDLPKLVTGNDESGHHWIGAREPGLAIVEFSDYECPHCRAAHKAIRLLSAKYPDQIRLVHRHFPLDMACNSDLDRPFHTRACLFAEATECAALQSRFWQMNDAIFSLQETTKTEDVDPIKLAVQLGLDRLEFKNCLESHATAKRVEADVDEGIFKKLKGTPTFVIGERLFMGKITEEQLKQLIGTKP